MWQVGKTDLRQEGPDPLLGEGDHGTSTRRHTGGVKVHGSVPGCRPAGNGDLDGLSWPAPQMSLESRFSPGEEHSPADSRIPAS